MLTVHDGFLFMVENNALYQLDIDTGLIIWKKELSDPTNLSFIDKNVYVLEQFHRIIYVLDIVNGEEIASLEISTPQVIGEEAQEMVTVGENLVFSRGCEVYVYGN